MKLENRVAVVSGAGRGIGRAIALAFAREGAKLVIMARTASQLDRMNEELSVMGAEVLVVQGDISRQADVLKVVKETVDRFGPPDILVNNASISAGKWRAWAVDYDDDAWQEIVRINLIGTYLMTKYFLKTMLPRKTGRIINMSSVGGKAPQPLNSGYSASKHGIIGLTKTVAVEVALQGAPGITVNAICPGATKTEMLEGAGGLFDFVARSKGITKEEAIKEVTGLNLQARLLDPEEVAGLALYLASDEGRGITGQTLIIDGGQVIQ
jgi:NAD(P)-dependent dehydrogenase (short-subunit alcohol dehydrogenase family)